MNNLPINCKIFRINMTTEDEKKDLDKLNNFLESNLIISTNEEFIRGKVDRWLVFVKYYKIENNEKTNKTDIASTEDNIIIAEENSNNETLKELFVSWRKEKAITDGVPLYRIISNSAIEELIKNKPEQVGKLHMIKGIGLITQEKYGSEIIGIIKNFNKGTN